MISRCTDSDELQHYLRLSNATGESCRMLPPIQGYAKEPLVSLEEAIEPLVSYVPDIRRKASEAKLKCAKRPAEHLTKDESAAILLYSMEWKPREECLYFVLNAVLRTQDRRKLIPWYLYLKLILTAFSNLLSIKSTVYRGVKGNWGSYYRKGEVIIWWGFNSCTTTMDVLKNDQFFGSNGKRTFFSIECTSGKDIHQHSQYKSEDEILLPPARQFKVIASLDQPGGLCMVQLKEIEPQSLLLETVSKDVPRSFSSATNATSTKSYKVANSKATRSEHEEFATPGTYKELWCEGRSCARCGKCRDWYYTDSESWQWVRNHRNWNSNDRRLYNIEKYFNYFKLRDSAKCDCNYLSYDDHDDHCLCTDNILFYK